VKAVITSEGVDLDARVSARFGRCPYFLLVDTEGDRVEAIPNPGVEAQGGAGVSAAQLLADRGAELVATGRVGPSAGRVLKAAGIGLREARGRTGRDVLQALLAGDLPALFPSSGGRGHP